KEAEAAARVMAERLSDLPGKQPPHWVFVVLANRLGGEKGSALIRPAIRDLARQMEGNATRAVASISRFLGMAKGCEEGEAADLMSRLDQSFAKQPEVRLELWGPLVNRGGPLGKAELAGPLALSLADRIHAEKNYGSLLTLRGRLEGIWGHVGEKDA